MEVRQHNSTNHARQSKGNPNIWAADNILYLYIVYSCYGSGKTRWSPVRLQRLTRSRCALMLHHVAPSDISAVWPPVGSQGSAHPMTTHCSFPSFTWDSSHPGLRFCRVPELTLLLELPATEQRHKRTEEGLWGSKRRNQYDLIITSLLPKSQVNPLQAMQVTWLRSRLVDSLELDESWDLPSFFPCNKAAGATATRVGRRVTKGIHWACFLVWSRFIFGAFTSEKRTVLKQWDSDLFSNQRTSGPICAASDYHHRLPRVTCQLSGPESILRVGFGRLSSEW